MPKLRSVILALDTSTPACTAALFAADGHLFASRDEVIGRGHAERLVPLIAEMLDGHMPSHVLVGVGPGSFTGIRIAIATAQGLGIGWDVPIHGMSSLALLAVGAPGDGPVAAALAGGHGELFVQQFRRPPLKAAGEMLNLPPSEAAGMIDAPLVIGSGAEALVAARGHGEVLASLPSASNALKLPPKLRSLDPKPLYARAPDARPREAA
jgi:tRNA threonylcarbamoyl adenosine modification protein YeaZ